MLNAQRRHYDRRSFFANVNVVKQLLTSVSTSGKREKESFDSSSFSIVELSVVLIEEAVQLG